MTGNDESAKRAGSTTSERLTIPERESEISRKNMVIASPQESPMETEQQSEPILTFKEFYEKYGSINFNPDNMVPNFYEKEFDEALFKHLPRKHHSIVITTTPKGNRDGFFWKMLDEN